MIVLTKNDIPYGIKINADEFFRCLRETQSSGNSYYQFTGTYLGEEVTADIDILADPCVFLNEERTVVFEPNIPEELWLIYGD